MSLGLVISALSLSMLVALAVDKREDLAAYRSAIERLLTLRG